MIISEKAIISEESKAGNERRGEFGINGGYSCTRSCGIASCGKYRLTMGGLIEIPGGVEPSVGMFRIVLARVCVQNIVIMILGLIAFRGK